MDERLQAGRHHLNNGERALEMGFAEDSRAHFEAALLQFRGPDLLLGEAHAQRGLALVELHAGQLSQAGERATRAISAYATTVELLTRLDTVGRAREHFAEARTGEAAARVLQGEVLARVGRASEAKASLDEALVILAEYPAAGTGAAAHTALARLSTREGRYVEAQAAVDRALALIGAAGGVATVPTLLAKADIARAQGRPESAERTLQDALYLARDAKNRDLEGRALAALASTTVQAGRLDEALQFYEAAVPALVQAADREAEGHARLGLGDLKSRAGAEDALETLARGARTFGALGHHHGLAVALLRISEHGLRVDRPDMALVAGEAARRMWRRTDPVRGQGLALRLVVKSLAALRRWQATFLCATLREAVVGDVQPNAAAVAAFYRARVPEEWVGALAGADVGELDVAATARVDSVLGDVLAQTGVEPAAVGDPARALELVEALAGGLRMRRVPAPEPADDLSRELTSEAVPDQDPADDAAVLLEPPVLEPLVRRSGPATEETDVVEPPADSSQVTDVAPSMAPPRMAQVPADEEPLIELGDDALEPLAAEESDRPAVPPAPGGLDPADAPAWPGTPAAPAVEDEPAADAAPGYDGLYAPPDVDLDDEDDDDDPSEELDLSEEVRALAGAPAPDGYEGLYAPPGADEDA